MIDLKNKLAKFPLLCSCPPAVGAVVAAPVALGVAGFTAGGIAAGSVAAKMMATAAVANGGGVAAGSVVAALQAAGKHHYSIFKMNFILVALTFVS